MTFSAAIISSIFVTTFLFVLYCKWKRSYWARKKVPTVESNSIWGNMENPLMVKEGIMFGLKKCHDELKKRGHFHGGIYFFNQAIYIPVDPELIKCILAKDFPHFIGHGLPFDGEREPLTAHLFNLDGEEWRNMRVKLTPTFTSGKMKMMFNTLLDCGVPMIEHIDKLGKNRTSLDIKEILACYTTDIIGSCAFGLECNSFKDPDAEFRKYGRQVFEINLKAIVLQFISFAAPSLITLLPLRSMPQKLETFFINAIKNIMEYRNSNNVKRNDFVQLFLEMNQKAKENGEEMLTLNQIAAQSFVFFLAGFETSSTTMTFCLHELAFNQDVQEKLRQEIRKTIKNHDGKLTYDGIMDMKYMDQVVNETLRKYPPVPFLPRVCNTDYQVPNTDVVIEKGTSVFISSLGLHRDAEYYPDPDKFIPERFSEETKSSRPTFAFLPFGEGPRMCIGLRFGLMQTKTGISMLINNYRILPGDGETYNIRFDPNSFVLTKKGKVTLNVEKLTV